MIKVVRVLCPCFVLNPPAPARLRATTGTKPNQIKTKNKNRLPEKVAADAEGKLVAFAHSEVGMLNNVIELWRYPSAAACVR